jgi:hypothetical protein
MTAHPIPSDPSVKGQLRAHEIAIDRLCLNLLTGAPAFAGVADEYRNALDIERSLMEARHG